MSFFSFGKSTTESATSVSKKNEASRALPATWYHSPALYNLERRAIFSKKWLLTSHQLRFPEPGAYVQFHVAGFNFFIIKNKEGTIRAFHNVCRHRAYPVIEGESGTAKILACKYHGWSYGLDGDLAKAPKYQDVPGFDKEANGLYPIHVHVDNMGFIWVNLEASPKPSVPWSQDFEGVDLQSRLQEFDFSKYHFDHHWSMTGYYNWKTLADNYNECYHCPTGHPGVNAISDLSKYYVKTKGGHIQHFNTDRPDVPGMGIYSTYYFPGASMTVSSSFFYMMRAVLISATETKFEYDVYRQNEASDKDFNYMVEFYRQVLSEDNDLCNAAQKNLNAGVFTNGELHPHAEKGPLYFQQQVKKLAMGHREEEEKAGREIWPATPAPVATDKLEEEVRFCERLDCCSSNNKMEW